MRKFHILSISTLLLIISCKKTISDEKPMFELVSSQESGLYFVNELNENEQLNILTYEYLYNGSGVAIGDINNDGLPDVFMGGNLFGGRLYLNKGNLKFEQISEKANVFYRGFSTGVSMVDINEDGWLDIYICRSLDNNIENRANLLLINNHDNTFTEQAAKFGLADTGYSTQSNFFDYDNDGDLDMFLVNHRTDFKNALTLNTFGTNESKQLRPNAYSADNACKLYRNNGNQTFTDISKSAGIMNTTFGLNASVADLNNDGWLDIFVANDYADKDLLYINNQNGTFTDKVDSFFEHISKNSMGSDFADFNNDGLIDLMSLDMVAEENYRQKQLKGNSPYDKYMLAASVGLHHQVVRNTLQLNNGDGSFSEIAQLAGVSHTDWSWSPLFADFDNDGWKDLYITNGYARDVSDFDFTKYDSDEAVRKANGKPKFMDLLNLMQKTPVSNYIFRNNQDLTFSNETQNWGLNLPSFSNGAAYADLDLDGDLDLVVNNFNSVSFLFKNNSRELSKNNYLTIELDGQKGNPNGFGTKVWIKTADTEQFFEQTTFRGFMSSSENKIHVGLGKNENIKELKVEWPNGKIQILKNFKTNQTLKINIKDAFESKNLPSNNKEKLFIQSDFDFTYQENDFVDFKREPLLEHRFSNKGPYVSEGDMNNDGLIDYFVGGASGQPANIFMQNSDNSYSKKIQPCFVEDKLYEDAGSVVFDIDNDKDLDILVSSGGYEFEENSDFYSLRLYKNDGKGNFTKSPNFSTIKTNASVLKTVDIDNDGDLDIFVGGNTFPNKYPYSANSYLLINEKGIFRNASNLLPNNGNLGIINDAEWIDIDNDKFHELVLVSEWMPITILKQKAGKYMIDENLNRSLKNTSGWWNCIEFSDIDQDGDLDFVAGNRGENSFFKAQEDKKAIVYAADFDTNGSIDAIPCYFYPDGKAYPKHILDELTNQIPSIKRTIKRYRDYSNATINDIFDRNLLKKSQNKEVQTFKTSLFLNNGNGEFMSVKIPIQAQFSSVKDILLQDLDGDKLTDILLVGNEYGSDVDSGRQDASFGCFLKGSGKGQFTSLSNLKTGLNLKGDSRKISYIKSNKQLLIWMNEGRSQAIKLNSR